jgi:2-C-methyl-D-erythritol 4-phosphate cytidylyltransferase
MSRFAVILPAAGRSSRFGGKEKKPFALLDGRAVWLRTVELFITRDEVCQTLLVISPEDRELFRTRYAPNIAFLDIQVIDGGAERFDSVANALAKLKDEVEYIAVHDAVRPCVEPFLIDAVFKKAIETGAAILGVPIADTIKRVDEKKKTVQETLSRQGLWLAQTPQVFRRDWMLEAYANRGKLGKEITDDAQLIEAAGHTVHVVEGTMANIKITRQDDLMLAKAILQSRPAPKVSGPAHPFASEEEMWR